MFAFNHVTSQHSEHELKPQNIETTIGQNTMHESFSNSSNFTISTNKQKN
jgi:hypothetical protein